jgi:hypothetical protein
MLCPGLAVPPVSFHPLAALCLAIMRSPHRELVCRPLQFHERSQDFIGADDETLSVAMRVYNPDPSPFGINARHPTPTPTGFAEIVSDDFQLLHRPLTDDSTPLAARVCSLQSVRSPSVGLQ